MLTSLLSLYIASALNPQIAGNTDLTDPGFSISDTAFPLAPAKDQKFISPIIEAKRSIAIDLNSGEILYEKNSHEKSQIASITKLMTILIVLEENKLNDVVTVSSNAANTEGSTMDLQPGEQIAVENLIYGAIINSANDAAVALAEYNAETVDAFIEKMNNKSKSLGLLNTNFSNPIGLDNPNNYSTAYDLAKLGKYIYENEFIKHAAGLKELEVQSVSKNYTHKLKSTNELLENEFYKIKGLKTGHTDGAGLCMLGIAENKEGNEILTVVLNSPARFQETKVLTDWIFRAYKW
jgi:D-alanyl-D-alanine carboxypeptidase